MSKINIKNNNILYYFLISSLHPKKKFFELINTNDKETYIEAQEILATYYNRNRFDIERSKIKSRNNSFHLYITNEELIFMSYTNKKFFSSHRNFELFDEINNYLIKNIKGRLYEKNRSFLIEDEKEEIKDIINRYIGEILSIKTIDSYLGSIDTEKENEKEILQMDINNNEILEDENTEKININNNDIINSNNNKNNIIIKKIKNHSQSQLNELTDKALNDKEKKKESSGEDILKNQINNNYIPYPKSDKYNNILLKNDNKNINNKISSKTVLGSQSKLKNKILENNIKNNISLLGSNGKTNVLKTYLRYSQKNNFNYNDNDEISLINSNDFSTNQTLTSLHSNQKLLNNNNIKKNNVQLNVRKSNTLNRMLMETCVYEFKQKNE